MCIRDRHKSDLKRLQALLRPFPQAYREMFRLTKKDLDNYVAYSGHGADGHRCPYANFSGFVKKRLTALRADLDAAAREEADRVLEAMDTGAFLPKQTTTDNGVIPHQLHLSLIPISADSRFAILSKKYAAPFSPSTVGALFPLPVICRHASA